MVLWSITKWLLINWWLAAVTKKSKDRNVQNGFLLLLHSQHISKQSVFTSHCTLSFFKTRFYLVTFVEDFDKTAIFHIALDSMIAFAVRSQLLNAGSQVVISSHTVLLPDVDLHQVAGDTGELELLPPGWVRVGVNDFGFFRLISNCHLMKWRKCKFKLIRGQQLCTHKHNWDILHFTEIWGWKLDISCKRLLLIHFYPRFIM